MSEVDRLIAIVDDDVPVGPFGESQHDTAGGPRQDRQAAFGLRSVSVGNRPVISSRPRYTLTRIAMEKSYRHEPKEQERPAD